VAVGSNPTRRTLIVYSPTNYPLPIEALSFGARPVAIYGHLGRVTQRESAVLTNQKPQVRSLPCPSMKSNFYGSFSTLLKNLKTSDMGCGIALG
jgi:hypothetical protein